MEDRSQFIGSSDIAAILGISPWRTAYDVWLEKTGQQLDEPPDPERERRLKRGQRLEPIVIEMLQEERDVWVIERNIRFSHPEYSFLAAQIDYEYAIGGEVSYAGNGETKTVDPRSAHQWGPDGSDEVPEYYLAQVMFGLAITGREQATIAALIGDDLRCYIFERDEELCAELIHKAFDFWNNHVIPKVPPPAQTKEDTSHMIKRFSGFTVEATDGLLDSVASLRLANKQLKEWKERKEDLELEIQKVLLIAAETFGNSAEAPPKITVLANGKSLLTWVEQSRAGYTAQPTTFRVMRISGKGE